MALATRPISAFNTQLWGENAIFRQVLGICSALAVTNLLLNTLLMSAGLIWAVVMSSITVSMLRKFIPRRVRLMVEVLIIAVYVIVVDISLRVYFPAVHVAIAAYVGLIITNCIVLGRLEAFAAKSRIVPSFFDGLGAGLGYAFVLMLIALVREVLGFGTVFGYAVPAREAWWHPWTIMVVPPGAFFVLGLVVWAARWYALRMEAAKKPAPPPTQTPSA